jgi:nitrite reductase/ring-hydroxylating ferredoxin subunit
MEVRIASTKDLSSGKMMGIENNGKAILVANLNGQYYAIGNTCTHAGCMLSDGTLNGEKVRCPCHGSTFDIRTGKVLKGLANDPEPSFNLRIDGDQILVSM